MKISPQYNAYVCDHCGWTTKRLHNMEQHEPACARRRQRVKELRDENDVLRFLFDGYFTHAKGRQ